jgi:hypothetical protein
MGVRGGVRVVRRSDNPIARSCFLIGLQLGYPIEKLNCGFRASLHSRSSSLTANAASGKLRAGRYLLHDRDAKSGWNSARRWRPEGEVSATSSAQPQLERFCGALGAIG